MLDVMYNKHRNRLGVYLWGSYVFIYLMKQVQVPFVHHNSNRFDGLVLCVQYALRYCV